MGDVLKDLMDAANNRIRSPFLGSILFVFLVVNWRPLFNLLFGDSPVLVRLAHFDNVTTWESLYLWPVVGGVVFALASPWLRYAGAWVAKKPVAHLKQLQDEAAHQHQIADIRRATELEERRAAEEEARERRKIEAAKREKEAEEVGGEELVEQLLNDAEGKLERKSIKESELVVGAVGLLVDVAGSKSGEIMLTTNPSNQTFLKRSESPVAKIGDAALRQLSRKEHLATSHYVDQLVQIGFLKPIHKDFSAPIKMIQYYQITHEGHEAADRFLTKINSVVRGA
ncbi:hypothetical protein SAMN04488527_12715 [Aliiroseovarius crassostreae]|uniref:Uncharacterized protein n=1 Tax=Aliiroseovarius crassostreae TaxID=154981 RepID=A0A0P7IWC7_9RHOB|nr:hypothetical protein [Aliiroseovarius crassostreae]KPN63718.1 hypothetical protein AKJ29_13960 [Aliiroseovarius crassostreae]SFU88086.1 hypothetical protein SAMN04488527_12715 [Aliiroseovarius crassostreae]